MSRYCKICRSTTCGNHGKDITLGGEGWKCDYIPVPTNADRIRAMTDEELAEFLAAKFADIHAQCAFEKEPPTATQLHAIAHTYFCAWMQWLKQPAEGDA